MTTWNKNTHSHFLTNVFFGLVLGFTAIGCGESKEQQTARIAKEKESQLQEIKKLDLDFDKGINTNVVFKRLQELAEANVPSAQGVLSAKFFNLGNFEKAKYWADKAAEGGDGRGMNTLGALYKRGAGNCEKSSEKAFEWFEKSARAGCSKGYLNMGFSYKNGEGCKKSPADALNNLLKAAEMEDAIACHYLGLCYYSGSNLVSRSETESVKWFEKAVVFGDHIQAKICLILCYAKQGDDQNMTKAFYMLGELPEDVLLEKISLPQPLLWKAILHFEKEGDLAAERKLAKALSQAKVPCTPDYRWLGRYSILLLDFNASQSKRESIIAELKGMSETSNVWQRAEVCIRLGQMHSKIKPFINYPEAASWFEKAAMTGTKKAISELIKFRKIYIDDFPEFMKKGCADAASDNIVNFSIGHGLAKGLCFKKDEREAEKWLVEAARRGSAEAYIDLFAIWDKREKGGSANMQDCSLNRQFCQRQVALLTGHSPDEYKINSSVMMASADEQSTNTLARIFGGHYDLKYLQPRMSEYNKGILSVADSEVLPQMDSKDLPVDKLFENPNGCVDDPNGLKSIFGVQFGAVIKKNIKPTSRSDSGELVYEFTPKKKFLNFVEYAIIASPITRRVVTLSAKATPDFKGESIQKQFDKVVTLLEEKYGRSAIGAIGYDGDNSKKQIFFRGNKGMQYITILLNEYGYIYIIAIDHGLGNEKDKECKQVERQSVLQKNGEAIDAL